MFVSNKFCLLQALGCLVHPTEEDIGQDRAPSFTFPSDHFSLVCDFSLTDGKRSNEDSSKETARDVAIRGGDLRETTTGDDVREANDDKGESFKGNKREDKDAKLKGECFGSKCTIRGLETKDVNFRGEDGKEKDCNDDQFKDEGGKDKDENIDDSPKRR